MELVTPASYTSGQTVAFESLKKVYPSHHDHGDLFARILKLSSVMKGYVGEILLSKASLVRPHDFYISGREFYIVQAIAGKGTFSATFFVVQISLEDGATANRVIKISKTPFEPEKEKLTLLSPASMISEHIDHFKETYKIYGTEKYIALFDASSCDFCHINYLKMRTPVSFAIHQLLSVARGIASFHRADLILRDIKGNNLLANWTEMPDKTPEERPGKVTDFGLVDRLSPEGKKHSTACTPTYAAPYIWENILCQKYRAIRGIHQHEGGVQGKGSDIFGLGRTIQYDMIYRMLIQLAGENGVGEVRPFIEMFLKPTRLSGKYSDKELLGFERVNPGNVIYLGLDQGGTDSLQVFLPPDTVLERTLKAIDYLQGHLGENEIKKLRGLAHLARDLQVTQKQMLLEILKVENENEGDLLIKGVISRLEEIDGVRPSVSRAIEFAPVPEERKAQKRKRDGSP